MWFCGWLHLSSLSDQNRAGSPFPCWGNVPSRAVSAPGSEPIPFPCPCSPLHSLSSWLSTPPCPLHFSFAFLNFIFHEWLWWFRYFLGGLTPCFAPHTGHHSTSIACRAAWPAGDTAKNAPELTPCVVCPDRRHTQSRACLAEPMSPMSPALELPQELQLLLLLHCCLPTWAPKTAKSKGGKTRGHPRREISPAVLGH